MMNETSEEKAERLERVVALASAEIRRYTRATVHGPWYLAEADECIDRLSAILETS